MLPPILLETGEMYGSLYVSFWIFQWLHSLLEAWSLEGMDNTGNNPSLTAAVVVTTGLTGANFAEVVMDKFGFKDPIARGMATASRFAADPYAAPLYSPR